MRPLVRPQGPRRMSRITPMGCCQWQRGLKREGISTKKKPRIATVSKAARPATDVAYNPSGVLPMAAGGEKRGYLHKKKGRVCDLFLLWRWADSNRRPSEPLQSFLHA